MSSNNLEELKCLFFKELKQYNSTNFKTLLKADLSAEDAVVHKACSSVVTRYFIFVEKHPEIDESLLKMLYYKLRIDIIGRYFSEYPASSLADLVPFQEELKRYVEKTNESNVANQQVAIE